MFIVVFNISVTSSRLNGVVFFSQVISIPAFARLLLLTFATRPDFMIALKIASPLYSFWNLDFFRTIIPDICMNVSTLEALALDYAIAVYPIFLIILSYLLILLYNRDIGCLVCMWRPFHKAFSIFKRNWNICTSVIDSFTTFFLLSYVKVLSVSSDLLTYIHVYSSDDKSSTRLLYDPTLHYFCESHLPYAVLALVLLTLFVIVPTLVLIVYPFQFFQKFLSIFPMHWHFLHAFIDSLQGCYDWTWDSWLSMVCAIWSVFKTCLFCYLRPKLILHVLCICSNSKHTMANTFDQCKSLQETRIFLLINRFSVSCSY